MQEETKLPEKSIKTLIEEVQNSPSLILPEDYTKETQERDKKLLKLTQFENSLKGLSPRNKKRAIDREAKKLGLNKI